MALIKCLNSAKQYVERCNPVIDLDSLDYLLDYNPKVGVVHEDIKDVYTQNIDIKELIQELSSNRTEPRQPVGESNHDENVERPTSACPLSIDVVDASEYNSIPKYMNRNMTLTELNLTVEALKKAILDRLKLRKANFNTLSKKSKDAVVVIREEQKALKLDKTSFYCSEAEFKDCLDVRLKAKLRWSVQMLRHVKRIKELHYKRQSFYVLI